jgi:hypothetical protein
MLVVTQRHVLLLALLLASPTVARAAQGAEGTATVPRFEEAPCPKPQGVEWLTDATCGYLVVPEDRSRPAGRTIRLMVAKHLRAHRRSDPIQLSIWPAGRATLPPWRSTGLSPPISSATGTSLW